MRPSRSSTGVVALLLLLVVVLASQAPAAESVTCSPSELLPCASAVITGSKPTPECCAKLKEQQPCFCQYLNDPSLRGYVNTYVNSPNGRRVAASCGVPFPKC